MTLAVAIDVFCDAKHVVAAIEAGAVMGVAERTVTSHVRRFRGRRDDSLADPETDERLRLEPAGKKAQITALFKEVVLCNRADAGEITTTLQAGPYSYVGTDRWRERPGRIRLVTP